jgi:hypothetical protein
MIWLLQLALAMSTGVLAIALLMFCSSVKPTEATRIHVYVEGLSTAAANRPLSALLIGWLTLPWQVPARVPHSLHASLLTCLEEKHCNDTIAVSLHTFNDTAHRRTASILQYHCSIIVHDTIPAICLQTDMSILIQFFHIMTGAS